MFNAISLPTHCQLSASPSVGTQVGIPQGFLNVHALCVLCFPFFCVFICSKYGKLYWKDPPLCKTIKMHLPRFEEWKICRKRPPCFIDPKYNARDWALHCLMFCANVYLIHLVVALVAVVAMTFFGNPNVLYIIWTGHHANLESSIASLQSQL